MIVTLLLETFKKTSTFVQQTHSQIYQDPFTVSLKTHAFRVPFLTHNFL